MFSPLWFNLALCGFFLGLVGWMIYEGWNDCDGYGDEPDTRYPPLDLLDSVGREQE